MAPSERDLSEEEEAYVVELLSADEAGVRARAARRLATESHPQILRALQKARKDTDALVRRTATVALIRLGDAQLRAQLLSSLHKPKAEVAMGAAVLLAEAGCVEAVADLIAIFPLVTPEVAQAVAQALGPLGDKRALAVLSHALSRPDVAPAAAQALGALCDVRAAAPLLRALASTHAPTRRQAARAIGRLCRESKDFSLAILAAPALERALLDADRSVRMNAAVALWHLDDPLRDQAALLALRDLSQATTPVVLTGEAFV